MNPPTQLDDLLYRFEKSLVRRDLSPNTVDAYHWALADLLRGMRLAGLRHLHELTREVLEEWQDTQLERDWSPRSRSLAVTATRQFLKFLLEDDKIDNKLERGLARVKIPEGRPRPIPSADLEKIKAHYLAPDYAGDLRERALFFVILTSGARITEALRMRADEYHDPEVIQKGGSTKRLMMPVYVHGLIAEYLNGRTDGPLWGDLTPAQARGYWRTLASHLGIQRFTTHAIRHTCATELLAAGIPEIVIAEHLGHHGLGTIRNYAKVLDKQRQSAVDAFARFLPSTPPEVA